MQWTVLLLAQDQAGLTQGLSKILFILGRCNCKNLTNRSFSSLTFEEGCSSL